MGQRQGGPAIGCSQHAKRGAFQVIAHQLDNFRFIINNQDRFHRKAKPDPLCKGIRLYYTTGAGRWGFCTSLFLGRFFFRLVVRPAMPLGEERRHILAILALPAHVPAVHVAHAHRPVPEHGPQAAKDQE